MTHCFLLNILMLIGLPYLPGVLCYEWPRGSIGSTARVLWLIRNISHDLTLLWNLMNKINCWAKQIQRHRSPFPWERKGRKMAWGKSSVPYICHLCFILLLPVFNKSWPLIIQSAFQKQPWIIWMPLAQWSNGHQSYTESNGLVNTMKLKGLNKIA